MARWQRLEGPHLVRGIEMWGEGRNYSRLLLPVLQVVMQRLWLILWVHRYGINVKNLFGGNRVGHKRNLGRMMKIVGAVEGRIQGDYPGGSYCEYDSIGH